MHLRGLGTDPIFSLAEHAVVRAVARGVGVGGGETGVARGEVPVCDQILRERIRRQT